MKEYIYDVAVIGAGPAGLAAAHGACIEGSGKVIMVERDFMTGGILPQCIHNGFGLHNLKEDLTGPEYAEIFAEKAFSSGAGLLSETMVLEITPGSENHSLVCVSKKNGLMKITARSLVLAMGCRERTRGNIALPGTRPAGIFTAGLAQRLTNIEGYLPGKSFVILGSGDIGMIMARRLTLEGASVKAVVEVMPYIGGLTRNRVQCLDDFGIPVFLNHTVSYISGNSRVEGVEIAEIDNEKKIIEGTRQFIGCDTLLLSVGLIPENELTEKAGIMIDPATRGPYVNNNFETSVPGIFACGNVLHVSDLVDHVSDDGIAAGRAAAIHAMQANTGGKQSLHHAEFIAGDNISYAVPQKASFSVKSGEGFTLSFRVKSPLKDARIILRSGEKIVYESSLRRVLRPGEMERIGIKGKTAQMIAAAAAAGRGRIILEAVKA